MLDAVDAVSSRRGMKLSDAMLLMECVSCVREVMNSKIGLECVIEKREYSRKLAYGG